MEKKRLDTEYINYELVDGILIGVFKPYYINIDLAKSIVNTRLEIINGSAYPSLVDSRKVIGMDKDARDYFSSESGRQGVKAAAMLVDSVFSSYLANFFLKVSVVKTYFPTRLFTNFDEALIWLDQYK